MQEQAKPRKKKKSGCGTVILAVLLVLVAAAAFVAFTLAGEIGGKEGGAQVTVTIEQGSGPATIGRKLADAGVIRYPTVFRLYAGRTGQASQLQYGEFPLTEGMGYDAILEALSRYAAAETVRVTFPEGTTALGIAALMEENGLCSAEEFLACANGQDGSDFGQYAFWGQIDESEPRFMKCEGYLFPETYEFFAEDTVYNYVDTFYAEFDRRVDAELRAQIEAAGMTLDDAVILASFVQEEAGNEEDQNVAEVFLNRLEPGSPFPRLESNASSYVQNPDDNNYLYNWVAPYYGGWENIPQELYDAYDTYKKAGLPAGPISNPGIEAIKAVVNPNTELVSENGHSPCYFFVTDLTGRYYYAATASEHQANVNTAWAVNDAL